MSYDPYGQQRPTQPIQPIQPPGYHPRAQHPWPSQPAPPQQQPELAPQRGARWAWILLAVVLVMAGGVGYWVWDTKIRTDSGIEACKALRDGKQVDGVTPTKAKTLTEANYRAARQVFQDSHYDDIKAAGTKMMDVVWQISQLGPDAGMGALAYLGQITSAATDLQGACANHGVIVNLNTGGKPTPTVTS